MAYLFGGQLQIHDYYILPIFFPLIAYLLLLSLMGIYANSGEGMVRPLRIALFTALLFTYFFADRQMYQKHHMLEKYNDSDYSSSEWLKGADSVLIRLTIPHEEHIAICDNAPNVGLVYCDRRGYNVSPNASLGNIQVIKDLMNEKHLHILIINSLHLEKMKTMTHQDFSDFLLLYSANNLSVLRYLQKQNN